MDATLLHTARKNCEKYESSGISLSLTGAAVAFVFASVSIVVGLALNGLVIDVLFVLPGSGGLKPSSGDVNT